MSLSVELRGVTCTVRSYRTADADSLARHGNNRAIWLNLRDRFPHPFFADDCARYIAHCLEATLQASFAIDVAGEAVGGISFHAGTDIERVGAELGYWVGEAFWGRGIATDAVRLLSDYALGEREYERLFALPFARNAASARVLEKAGYLREGTLRRSCLKNGVLEDQLLYAKLRAGREG